MALELSADDFGGARHQGCNEALVLTRPDVVRAIHEAYLAAGADVVETDTFTGSRLKLDEYGFGERTRRNQPARRARSRAKRATRFRRPNGRVSWPARWDRPACSSRRRIRRSRTSRYEQLRDIYGEQARALVEGGVDLLLLETMQDLLELKAAIAGIRARVRARHAARADSSAADAHHRRPDAARHRHPRDRCATLDALHVDVIGLNCSTGPGADARLDSLSVRKLALLRQRHSERGPAADGTEGRNDLSRNARRAGARARGLRARLRRQRRRRLLRNDARAHRGAARGRRRGRRASARRTRRATRAARGGFGDDRGRARARAAPAHRRRAHQRARLAQDQAAAAWTIATTTSCWSRANKSKAARTCSTSAAR